jgi:hypothetical protein
MNTPSVSSYSIRRVTGNVATLQLDPERILETVNRLRDRVVERFPESGLANVAGSLVTVADASLLRARWIARPQPLLRAIIALLIVGLIALFIALIATIHVAPRVGGFGEFLQAIEAGVNDLIFMGAAIYFLLTLEGRTKRRRALLAIRELRALAHIVDMHQLTKDPDRIVEGRSDTPSSPRPEMSRFELVRYLDYCSEMLALISKIAALYVQDFDDSVTLAAVDEVETLTTGLSRKIWQKIMILDRAVEPT